MELVKALDFFRSRLRFVSYFRLIKILSEVFLYVKEQKLHFLLNQKISTRMHGPKWILKMNIKFIG